MYWLLAVLIGVEVHWQVDQATADVWPLVSALAATLLFVSTALWGRRIFRWPLGALRRPVFAGLRWPGASSAIGCRPRGDLHL